ncbi:unnamed protein product [Coregonus sp. 'balchen']|nr:unnamed protein product [Coregonus sp. 'balchen']
MLPNIKSLRMFLNRRLTAAVDELFGAVETTIADYQQEFCRSKEEKDRTIAEYQEQVSRAKEENARLQKLLDVVLKPEIKLQRLEVNSDWSATQSESDESVDRLESKGPPLKSKRTQTKAGPSFHVCTKVRESTELSHLKSPILNNTVRRCRICAKPFITKESLVIHAHRHTKLSRCGICGRSFESVESLKDHLNFHVGSTGSLSCYICGICFTEDEEVLLEEHMSNHKLKLYRCLGCNESFDTRQGLTLHMRTHTRTLDQYSKLKTAPTWAYDLQPEPGLPEAASSGQELYCAMLRGTEDPGDTAQGGGKTPLQDGHRQRDRGCCCWAAPPLRAL